MWTKVFAKIPRVKDAATHRENDDTSFGAETLEVMCAQDNQVQETDVILQRPFGLQFTFRHVVAVTPGGNADQSGKVEVGMTVVAVNGQDCTAMAHSKIKEMIKLMLGLEPTGAVRLRFSKV